MKSFSTSLAYSRTPERNATGLVDLELSINYRFLTPEQDDSSWMASRYPMLELPTGHGLRYVAETNQLSAYLGQLTRWR